MKKGIYVLFFIFSSWLSAQENPAQYTVDIDYYYGSILPHNKKIFHLIKQHPEGVFVSGNRKTFGKKEWQSRLNYPDYGLTLHYQNNKNKSLGDLYSFYLHYSFYFFNRNLQFQIGQGLAYSTNPYDKDENYRNIAYGSALMPATLFKLNYQKENIWKGLGFHTGFFLAHHSNATLKSPNTGTNTVGMNFGLQYLMDYETSRTYLPKSERYAAYSEPVRFNFAFRAGVHESHIIGSGRYPFYTLSAYADKRISHSSAFQLGVDAFLSRMRKREIKMIAVSFPEKNIKADADYRRLGAFVGYELFINRLSFVAQAGKYIYNQYPEDSAFYELLGLKYYISKHLFTGFNLRTHFSKAQALEFSMGIRL